MVGCSPRSNGLDARFGPNGCQGSLIARPVGRLSSSNASFRLACCPSRRSARTCQASREKSLAVADSVPHRPYELAQMVSLRLMTTVQTFSVDQSRRRRCPMASAGASVVSSRRTTSSARWRACAVLLCSGSVIQSLRPIHSAICGTSEFPRALSRSTRCGTPWANSPDWRLDVHHPSASWKRAAAPAS